MFAVAIAKKSIKERFQNSGNEFEIAVDTAVDTYFSINTFIIWFTILNSLSYFQ